MKTDKYPFAILTLSILLSACGMFKEFPPHVQEAGRITHRFVKEVYDTYPYEPFGTGGGFSGAVNGFEITFRTFQEISEAQAVSDIHQIYARLFNIINQDEIIRPYLKAWPFPETDTRIGLLFFDPSNGGFRRPPHLATISINNGKMYKTVEDPETSWLMSPEEYEQKYGYKFTEAHESGGS
jgi:hypothetical protein